MYIISKHKDYYDGVVQSVGIDKTIVYGRSPLGIKATEYPKPFKIEKKRFGNVNSFTNISFAITKESKYDKAILFIIGFCGKLYLGWRLLYKVKEYDYDLGCHREVDKYDIVYGYKNVKHIFRESYFGNKPDNEIKYIEDYDPINIFRELKAPVFVYNSSNEGVVRYHDDRDKILVVNPILKDYEFYKVIDPVTAFQELQMFISGVLGIGEKEIIEVEDKYKIGQHGFDKHSFRKEPGQKKRRK